MIINMLLSWYRSRDLAQQSSRTEPLQGKEILTDMVAHEEEVKTKSKPLTVLANHLHLSTFLPLAIITILQDVDLALGALVCVAEIIFFMLLGFVLYRKRYIKVFPKKYDVFNLQVRSVQQQCCQHQQQYSIATAGGRPNDSKVMCEQLPRIMQQPRDSRFPSRLCCGSSCIAACRTTAGLHGAPSCRLAC